LKKSYKTKLNISSERDLKQFNRIAGFYRKIYNLAMELQETRVFYMPNNRQDLFFVTGTELSNKMSEFFTEKQLPYLKEFDKGVFRAASMAANKAFVSNYKKYLRTLGYSGLTKYKSRKKGKLSFKTIGQVKVFYDYITLPKFGKVKLFEKGYIPQGKKYSNFTFSFDGVDWWMSVDVTDESVQTIKEERTGKGIFFDFDKKGNLYINGEKKYENIVSSEKYQRHVIHYKKLAKKLKRQTLESLHWSKKHFKKVSMTTRNILKTKKSMSKISNHMTNMKKDYFRKVANELARLKPCMVLTLPNNIIRVMKNGFLTRFLRESSTKEFFNILINKFKNTGVEVQRYFSPRLQLA